MSGKNKRLSLISFFALYGIFLFSFSCLASLSRPAGAAEVNKVSLSGKDGAVEAAIETSGPVEYSRNFLHNPYRFYVDLKDSVLKENPEALEPAGVIKNIRVAQYNASTVRVVFELEKPVSIKVIKNLPGPGLRIDFLDYGSGANENMSGEDGEARVQPVSYRPVKKIVREKLFPKGTLRKWRIVIDAGHGGHDPGAIGPDGVEEKNMTLAIAKKLASVLDEDPKYDVHLTRDSDKYLTLEQRTQIANKLGADLFISIHINSSPHKTTRGIETYFLNWTDDEEANRVAARENAISVRRMKESRSELGAILASLELQDKRDDSLKLANFIQRRLIRTVSLNYPRETDHGVKQALFYVLVGARMPSVLVEVSFISNHSDEDLLTTEAYQETVSKGIAAGIGSYLKEIPSQDVAQR
ncbi:MAG: N-acetylmuramoyl-L-alanine amidase [Nitrospiraceae bacterium]|nr:N-acetylmuramoyl-L-alanine amidase [Nitrospiraceae bacterium]